MIDSHCVSVSSPPQHVCMDCKKNYCGRCSAQLEPQQRLCHTCQRFHGTLFERTELMKLKVKDLRDYLHLHEVSTQMCREKEELVELVLGQQTPSSSGPIINPLTQTQTPTATQHETTPLPAPTTSTTTPSTHPDSTSADHVPSQPPPTQEGSQVRREPTIPHTTNPLPLFVCQPLIYNFVHHLTFCVM